MNTLSEPPSRLSQDRPLTSPLKHPVFRWLPFTRSSDRVLLCLAF